MTDDPGGTARHLGEVGLAQYVAAGVRATVPITGSPQARLVVDVPDGTLRLEVEWDGEEPPALTDYTHLSADIVYDEGRNWSRLTVHGRGFFSEAYPLLRSVADLVQLGSATFTEAVATGMARYHELLAAAGSMPVRDEIGLFGELLTLEHLIGTMGASASLQAWRGGDQTEEHDLGLIGDDVEIKTTTADARQHWIGSLNQLRPSTGRPLWLLSIQLTGAGAGPGRRLPDLITAIDDRLPQSERTVFRSRIADTTFRPQQPPDRYKLLRMRSTPRCYPVDDTFPRLTRELLSAAATHTDRIRDVSYLIDLDGLPVTDTAPTELTAFGEDQR